MVVIIPFAAFFRALIAWTYNVTAHSILLAATIHASFNTASGSRFIEHLSPTGSADPAASLLPLGSVVVIACLVALISRGRLGQPSSGRVRRGRPLGDHRSEHEDLVLHRPDEVR